MEPNTGEPIKYGDLIDHLADSIVGGEEGPLGLNYNEAESRPLKLPVGDGAIDYLGYGDTVRARVTVDDMGICTLKVKPKSIFSRDERTFVFSPADEDVSRGYVVHEVTHDRNLEHDQDRAFRTVPPNVAAGLFETLRAAA
jgi:hypothetical protein